MTVLKVDMLKTILLAIVLLLMGAQIRKMIPVLKKYCIPSAVVGGLLFSILTTVLYSYGILSFQFDSKIIQTFFMNIFFAASGCAAGLALLKKGGKLVAIFTVLTGIVACLQNAISVFLGKALGVNPLLALMTGSTPLTGGHGNAAAYAPMAEGYGAVGAMSVAMAAATYGLVAGCIIGGPIGNSLIKKYKLYNETPKETIVIEEEQEVKAYISKERSMKAAFIVLISLGVGQIIFDLSKFVLPSNVTIPIHVMCMFAGVIVRNVYDLIARTDKDEALYLQIDIIGDISLAIFVSMAIMTMRLWELKGVAGALIIILLVQTVMMYLFATQITFRVLGKNYDAAVMAVGHTGFGMGAVPVSMVTMKTVCDKYRYSKLAFFVVPIVGGLISNFTNAAAITYFIEAFK